MAFLQELMPSSLKKIDTSLYFVDDRGKHDWLVETWAEKLDDILNLYQRHGSLVAETQSIRDQGIDVFWKYKFEGVETRIGFQIKSNQEAIRNEKPNRTGESMIATLKRQAFEAISSNKVDQWWVVPCFDLVTHKNLVSQIGSDIITSSSPIIGSKVHLVNPIEAMSILSKSRHEIDTFGTKLLCADDEILVAAQAEIDALSEAAAKAVLYSFVNALTDKRRFAQDQIFDLIGDADNIADVAWELESHGYLTNMQSDIGEFRPEAFPGMCGLFYEAKVRHKMDDWDAADFLLEMLGDNIRVDDKNLKIR